MNKSTTSVRLAAALIICLGLTGTASADILWEQHLTDMYAGGGGFPSCTYFSAVVADDFQLSTADSIRSVSWTGGANEPASVNGFYVRFYENDVDPGYPPYEDDPGKDPIDYHRPAYSPAYSEYIPIGSVAATPVLRWDGVPDVGHFDYKANLTSPFEATEDTHYWFGVQADTGVYTGDPNTGPAQPWWGWLPGVTTNLDPGVSNQNPVNGLPWVGQGYYDFTYSLNSTPAPVPIPGAVWLLGSGFAGLVGLRRKLKK